MDCVPLVEAGVVAVQFEDRAGHVLKRLHLSERVVARYHLRTDALGLDRSIARSRSRSKLVVTITRTRSARTSAAIAW